MTGYVVLINIEEDKSVMRRFLVPFKDNNLEQLDVAALLKEYHNKDYFVIRFDGLFLPSREIGDIIGDREIDGCGTLMSSRINGLIQGYDYE